MSFVAAGPTLARLLAWLPEPCTHQSAVWRAKNGRLLLSPKPSPGPLNTGALGLSDRACNLADPSAFFSRQGCWTGKGTAATHDVATCGSLWRDMFNVPQGPLDERDSQRTEVRYWCSPREGQKPHTEHTTGAPAETG